MRVESMSPIAAIFGRIETDSAQHERAYSTEIDCNTKYFVNRGMTALCTCAKSLPAGMNVVADTSKIFEHFRRPCACRGLFSGLQRRFRIAGVDRLGFGAAHTGGSQSDDHREARPEQ